jgi:hypothetical protein
VIQQRERPAWEGYGAVDGKESLGTRPSKQFYDDEHTGYGVIDHGSVRNIIPAQPADIIMKWARTRKHQSHSQTPTFEGPSSIASGNGSSPRNNSRLRSSPPISISHHNSKSNDPPTLPSDAVGLVVGDSHTLKKNISMRERKEVTAASQLHHLKKVYYRGGGRPWEDHGESGC